MYLERLLQINMAALATFGALLLGMGQRNVGPPLLVALAAGLSIWLTDITQWFHIGRRVANVLMLLAAIASLHSILSLGTELQTLGLAWFVTCLQIILFFQKKDHRVYWLLVMLSLLQVVVATLFNQGVVFGMLLAAYMFAGSFAMVLLILHQQCDCHRPRSMTAAASPVPTASRDRPRWPLSMQETQLTSSRGTAHAGLGRPLIGWLARTGLATLAITLVLFLAMPRSGAVTWRGVAANQRSLVGYSDKVTLGELGQLIESHDEVMRVRLLDPHGGKTPAHPAEVYLQGAVLMSYANGQWETAMPAWDARVQMLSRAEKLPDRDFLIQEIKIEPLDRDELFYIAPFVPLASTGDMTYDYTRQRLLRSEQLLYRQFGYRLGTTAIVDGVQKPLTPSSPKDSTGSARKLPGANAKPLPKLVELATRWIEESKLPEDDRLGRARYLERKLAMSSRFQYSLVGQDRNPDVDPIEDFVAEHPAGHCEYFATALTLMLRSQNIPARMLVGYKCDEWNPAGRFYQVRQLHAHTWVEVHLRARDIRPAMIHGKDYWRWSDEGGWLRLDPTPGGGTNATEPSAILAPFRRGLDWLDAGWSDYVLDLDFERQRDAIYQPIVRAIKSAWHQVTDGERWRTMFVALLAAFHLEQLNGASSWLVAAVVTILATGLLVAVAWIGWRLAVRFVNRPKRNQTGRSVARRSDVEFYRRFETLLGRQGIVRLAGQTQQQFAAAAAARLAAANSDLDMAVPASIIVETFYRVRFGHERLDRHGEQAVDRAMQRLSQMMASRKRRATL